jgi:hypothetical protein
MRPGTVRAVEYEIVPRDVAESLGLAPTEVTRRLGEHPQVAVLRCVDDVGQKMTAVGDPDHLRRLLASGQASDREGMPLMRSHWPVVLRGWRQAS